MKLAFKAEIRKILGDEFYIQQSEYSDYPPWRTKILMRHPIRLFLGKLSRWREVAWSIDSATILTYDEGIAHLLEDKLPSKFMVELC